MTIDISDYPEFHKFLSTPEADHLAELYLLKSDLDAAHRTLKLYFDKFPALEGDDDAVTISASLFRDGILLYCSCFSKRDQRKLEPQTVYGHLDDWEPYYQKLVDTRDAFVAHNFGPQRQHKIVVIALGIGKELVPAGFVQVWMRFAGWLESEGKQLLEFIDVARVHLGKRVEAAEQPVLDMLTGISSEELESLADAEFKLPEARDIRASRSAFNKSGRGLPRPLPSRRWARTIEGELEPRRSDPPPPGPAEEAPPEEG